MCHLLKLKTFVNKILWNLSQTDILRKNERVNLSFVVKKFCLLSFSEIFNWQKQLNDNQFQSKS